MRPRLVLAVGLGVIALVALGAWLLVPARRPLPEGGLLQTVQSGDLSVTVQLDQERPGTRTVDVLVRDAAGRPVDAREVRLTFQMRTMDMGVVSSETTKIDQGHFQARGPFFTMAGEWDILAAVRLEGREGITPRFTFPIAVEGEAAGPVNPLPGGPETVSAGRLVYQSNCVACHGPSGRGDGPAGLSLQPRPSDFAQHMLAGLHTDGQIFLWIKNGYPNTAMPAWGGRLSDEQIWQLVHYLRTFAPVSVAAGPTQGGAARTPLPTLDAAGPTRMVWPTPPPEIPTATPPPVPDSQEPLPPLVFAREGNLWRSVGDGSEPTQLTKVDGGSYVQYPAVSPDGRQIAYVVVTEPPPTATLPLPTSALYLMDADGSNQRTLWKPEQGQLSMPNWSPDGKALYLAANGVKPSRSGSGELEQIQVVRLDLASGEQRELAIGAIDPNLTRDGGALTFVKFAPEGTMSVQVARSDGSAVRTVIDGKGFEGFYAPRFTPDGRQVVVAAIGGPATDERGVPLPPAGQSPLDRLLGLLEPPAAQAHGAPWDLWVANVDGSGLRRLTTLYEDLPMAAFSPDGRTAVVMGANGMYLMSADGSNLRRISPMGDHGGLDWAGK
jgi:mono/diheme cytochrome c family protein